jgi:hypothetical protein
MAIKLFVSGILQLIPCRLLCAWYKDAAICVATLMLLAERCYLTGEWQDQSNEFEFR